jgi:uncharacterized protein YggE
LSGYQASNEITLRLDDISRAGIILDAMAGAGANQMNGIGFAIAQPEPLLEKARVEAIADARRRAETYAKAAGVTLGPILSISESPDQAGPRPVFRMAMAQAVPVAPGEQSLHAEVTVVWEIR